ncbi:hypothetical protein ASPZODRAFT_127040 [Penicilliopsis zonata CBS 506.65]|uniref:Alpha-1,2-mannosyltransferase n=1 Tax=Penicilliopsis zonata CBS 506.65 TaxID=1073090 RepID=A0A1L9SVA6_9EURO|nr:hypothetical protein ASPZODRAFT_127040 [Penicilliopsis zonata CBS 506.65]OJJ51044.1 hypothetical protein ASPZODRAFT_127040 [Penicilliopsis zonata CBS 506.65]
MVRPGALRTAVLATGAVSLVCFVYLYWTPPSTISTVPTEAFEVPLAERQSVLWEALYPLLQENSPQCPPPERQGDAGAVHYDAVTDSPRPDHIALQASDLAKMRTAHQNFVRAINDSTTMTKTALSSPHTPGTRGIVSTAGGSYLPVFLASLRMLRRSGSTLPVEVYMKDSSEYEASICEEVLPGLDARCLVLADVVGRSAKIEHYQLKIFAVLFSSFEEVVWMDADCFPLYTPETLLESEPFLSTGLVTFPDFWASTASPLYFRISDQPDPPMTLRQASETGAFLVSKKSHFTTLLLAAYYNYYGPTHYFRLLSQGAPGEGDKETFINAASALSQPFYTVSERVQAIGHAKPDGSLSGSAMMQSDPQQDYARTSQDLWRVKNESVTDAPRAFFIHAHYPKFNPAENVFGYKWETTPTLNSDGSLTRAWTAPEKAIQRFGYDAERAYWEEIMWVACNLQEKIQSWSEDEKVCERVQKYWKAVFDNTYTIN